jgi:hypothetical protein
LVRPTISGDGDLAETSSTEATKTDPEKCFLNSKAIPNFDDKCDFFASSRLFEW